MGKKVKELIVALSVQNFIKMANYYNQTAMMLSAICVQKGGIAIENYAGRFFAADVLEFVVEYGHRLRADKNIVVPPEIDTVIERFAAQLDAVRDLITPTQKPIYEMTLAEFEKLMNI